VDGELTASLGYSTEGGVDSSLVTVAAGCAPRRHTITTERCTPALSCNVCAWARLLCAGTEEDGLTTGSCYRGLPFHKVLPVSLPPTPRVRWVASTRGWAVSFPSRRMARRSLATVSPTGGVTGSSVSDAHAAGGL
jgi:hypothetical protein